MREKLAQFDQRQRALACNMTPWGDPSNSKKKKKEKNNELKKIRKHIKGDLLQIKGYYKLNVTTS